MRICGICQKKSLKKLPLDMFVDKIGNPPLLISELLAKIANDVDHQFMSNEICRQCTNKICQYYSAKQMMEKVQSEILHLIQNPVHAEFEVEAVYNYSVVCKTDLDNAEATYAEQALNNPLAEENQASAKHDLNQNKQIESENSLGTEVEPDNKIQNTQTTEVANKWLADTTLNTDCKLAETTASEFKSTIDCSNSIGVPTFRSTGKGKPTGIKCENCDRVFENHKTFQAHKKYNGFSGYVCELCGTTLFSHSGFITHTKSHRAEKEFQCPDCDAQFHRKAKLTHHMAWHKNEKPFQCEICAKCFVHRVALTKHRHIHSDVTRRNECKICGKKFRTLTHLTRHTAIHTGAKPFSCPTCGKCFSQSYNMKSHIKQHEAPRENNYKRLRCQKCLKTFARSSKYEEHIKLCLS